MRKTRRTSRVGESVRDALVEVFRQELNDLSLGLTSITGVEVSPDLHFARVFISGLDEKELDFKFDETTMRAGRIEDLLSDINKEPKSGDEES
jgi:ribosome-binding factor A